MVRKNNHSSFTKKRHHRVPILLLLNITLLLVSTLLITSTQSSSTYLEQGNVYSIDRYTENGRVHNEVFINWPDYANLGTIMLRVGSIIHVNYTVLATSNSSVEFEIMKSIGHENRTLFSPEIPNFVLAPGESLAEDFTVVNGTAEYSTELSYDAYLLSEGGNATVHWWYEIIKKVKMPAPGFLFSFGTVTVLTIIVILINKRRKSF
ncbi:MAG: hypothetical protein HGN29_17945 [Asgard group archaeon]|nr:hypothetical protein [Asgard group archaeon]